jgi:hypothetical protein
LDERSLHVWPTLDEAPVEDAVDGEKPREDVDGFKEVLFVGDPNRLSSNPIFGMMSVET